MKQLISAIIVLTSFVIYAQEARYEENATTFMESLLTSANTSVNSDFISGAELPENLKNSWVETPNYFYSNSVKHADMINIVSKINALLDENDYLARYDEKSNNLVKRLKKNPQIDSKNYPTVEHIDELEQEFIAKAMNFVKQIPEIGENVILDAIGIEKSGSALGQNDAERFTEIRVFFRRVFDGAILNDGKIPVKIVFDTATEVIKHFEVNWNDYESLPNFRYFQEYSIGDISRNIRDSFAQGKFSVGIYGKEVFDSIHVYSVEKIWRKKYCNGEYFLIPALRFYTKVYSEKGIKSIPELAEAKVKETFFSPVYELVYSDICQFN